MFIQSNGRLGYLPELTEPPVEETSPSWLTSAFDALKSGITVYNQQRIIDANVERASRGLPPLNTASIAPTVNVGVSPEIKNMLMLGGVALLGIALLRKKR